MIESIPYVLTGIGIIVSILYYTSVLRNANRTRELQLKAQEHAARAPSGIPNLDESHISKVDSLSSTPSGIPTYISSSIPSGLAISSLITSRICRPVAFWIIPPTIYANVKPWYPVLVPGWNAGTVFST